MFFIEKSSERFCSYYLSGSNINAIYEKFETELFKIDLGLKEIEF